jgi:predicted RNase H-like HicB family nuclease
LPRRGVGAIVVDGRTATMRIEIEREDDGRWIAEVPDLPGAMAYGQTRADAVAKAEALALRVIADRLEHGEAVPELDDLFALPV